ncbi:MAG: tRNA (guanosine(46)-N7)-methyltransferase TrmB [Candidatus Omnitrophota bacterium]
MCAKTIYHYTPEMDEQLVSPGSIDEKLDFEKIFGNRHPVEIEIGTGKGRFILAESRRRPETNFIGIERSLKWIRIALWRAARDPRPNRFFLCLDADLVVKLLTPPRSIAAYHVYFPDPWPKDRHRKRRLFNSRLLEKMAETLVAEGRLLLKTDHAEYYADARQRIDGSGLFSLMEDNVSNEIIEDREEAPDSATHYEIKFRQESRPIYSAAYQVVAAYS